MLEALLFAEGGPLLRKRILSLLEVDAATLEQAIAELTHALTGRGLALIVTHDELELRTAPAATDLMKKFRESELSRDLGKASLETLALILYRNGATRTEIDWIRGVNSATALRALMLRGLIERSEDTSDKRRALYTPTVEALAHLGITSVSDLPRYAELMPLVRDADARREAEAAQLTDV